MSFICNDTDMTNYSIEGLHNELPKCTPQSKWWSSETADKICLWTQYKHCMYNHFRLQ